MNRRISSQQVLQLHRNELILCEMSIACLAFYFTMSKCVLKLTEGIGEETIFFEGVVYTVYYFLKTLNGVGAGTLLGINFILYLLRTAELLIADYFATARYLVMSNAMVLYPTFQLFECTVLGLHCVISILSRGNIELPENLYIYLVFILITKHYYHGFEAWETTDIAVGVVIYGVYKFEYGVLSFLNSKLLLVKVVIMTIAIYKWIETKSARFAPIGTFPIRIPVFNFL